MKVKKIAVFDSIEDDLTVTAGAVREYYDRRSEKADIREFTEAYTFICDFRDNYYDMAFLGMNGMLDVETARSIGHLDLNCPLFFVSAVGDYGMEGYRLNILDYLLKPVTHDRVSEAISRIGSVFAKGRGRAGHA